MSRSTTAIVLAGGPRDALAELQPGAPNKAFVQVGGVPMVARVLEALGSASQVGRRIVVAPRASHTNPALALADERRDDGIHIRDSLRNGLVGLDPDALVLISASDLPILPPVAIDDFIARAYESNADVHYGCVERRIHMAAYPNVRHTWVHLADGTYCGGGFVVLRPRIMPLLESLIERLGAARKSPLRLATLFGISTLVKYATQQLSIADCERRACTILGAQARAVISPYAETALNVDRISDLAPIEAELASLRRATQ